ncbi:hypothetical protein DICVIV_10595 [Dictyocaulus viviparus]|uniref:Uncharacterized protein n=1 Tax=Dictyocaulus viviparus TaxID=29172 RepID=A0A0D8XHZ5_DICVI|nr:hypothetical protein DICVIV_10595 [Dictyocaulus viviparus]
MSGCVEIELQEILTYLTQQMIKVEKAIGTVRIKRASPISASLPNRDSAYFLNRIGALKKSLANKNETKISESLDSPTKSTYGDRVITRFHLNDSFQNCKRLTQPELVTELKQKGTYNPDLMAWDAIGVIRFLDRSINDHYQRQPPRYRQREEAVSRNVEALASLLKELNVTCDIRSPFALQKLQNTILAEPRRTVLSPSLRRTKRMDGVDKILRLLNSTIDSSVRFRDQPNMLEDETLTPRQKLIGKSHIVPFGCDKRGAEEDGYLRLCGACQAIRHLPDTFFPPFINEVTCDNDKACLYFYDYQIYGYSSWKMQAKAYELCGIAKCGDKGLPDMEEIQPQCQSILRMFCSRHPDFNSSFLIAIRYSEELELCKAFSQRLSSMDLIVVVNPNHTLNISLPF